jgi:hypothetical protein
LMRQFKTLNRVGLIKLWLEAEKYGPRSVA